MSNKDVRILAGKDEVSDTSGASSDMSLISPPESPNQQPFDMAKKSPIDSLHVTINLTHAVTTVTQSASTIVTSSRAASGKKPQQTLTWPGKNTAGAAQRKDKFTSEKTYLIESDGEDDVQHPSDVAKPFQTISAPTSVGKTDRPAKTGDLADVRHKEVIGAIRGLMAQMRGLEDQVRDIQTNIKILQDASCRVPTTGPPTRYKRQIHY